MLLVRWETLGNLALPGVSPGKAGRVQQERKLLIVIVILFD